jgi:hypothetical protein
MGRWTLLSSAENRLLTAQEVGPFLQGSGSPNSHWFLGFGFGFVDVAALKFRAVGIPHWFLALLFAILPMFHVRAILRSRKCDRKGLCPKCGYDLRATPDRCPECGNLAPIAGHRERR